MHAVPQQTEKLEYHCCHHTRKNILGPVSLLSSLHLPLCLYAWVHYWMQINITIPTFPVLGWLYFPPMQVNFCLVEA